jgi:hypothetical protein
MNSSDEFYIGWQNQAPTKIGAVLRKTTISIFIVSAALAALFALVQRSIGVATFEWGTLKNFTGTLQTTPYPHLLVTQPGHAAAQSDYLLVAPFKHGLEPDSVSSLDGKLVSLKGTLIFRDNQTMIEVRPDTIKTASNSNHQLPITSPPSSSTNHVTLVGEIVDSKCYLGVMNPGHLTPHRACAVRCISGGIPPILLVQRKNAAPLGYLLVSSDGRPVNKQVLDMVAEPVEITGDLVQQGGFSILRADPSTYRRVKN